MMAVPHRRIPRIALVLTIAAAVSAVGAPAGAEASFASKAEAQTFHVTITNDEGSIPTLPQIDAGIGTAQASFSSYGGGLARAASPDAGSAASVPALLGAVVPTLIPKPLPFAIPSISIPGDITVQTGQKPAKVGTGPYALSAAVTDASASAKATLGGALDDENGVLRTLSKAEITVGEDDSVTATASSVVDGVRINGLVSIGRVQSEVEVVRDPDGTIHRSSETEIGLLKIAGLSFSFKDDQFLSPLGPLPVSIKQVSKLLGTVTGGQFKLAVSEAKKTPKGMTSSSLQLIQTVPPPPKCVAIPLPTPVISGVTYCGTTTVVYDFGKASATTDYALIEDTPPPSDGGGSETETPIAPPPADGGTDPDLGSGDLPVAAPPVDVEVPGAENPVLTSPAADGPPLLSVSARFVDMANLYLALVGFAVLLLLSSTCLRLLGVRNKWTS